MRDPRFLLAVTVASQALALRCFLGVLCSSSFAFLTSTSPHASAHLRVGTWLATRSRRSVISPPAAPPTLRSLSRHAVLTARTFLRLRQWLVCIGAYYSYPTSGRRSDRQRVLGLNCIGCDTALYMVTLAFAHVSVMVKSTDPYSPKCRLTTCCFHAELLHFCCYGSTSLAVIRASGRTLSLFLLASLTLLGSFGISACALCPLLSRFGFRMAQWRHFRAEPYCFRGFRPLFSPRSPLRKSSVCVGSCCL